MDLKELTKKTKKVVRQMPVKWSVSTRFIDLVEEVGELANALLVKEGAKPKNKQKAEIANSLCDILFDLLLLADYYGVDFDKAYQEVLREIERRIEEKDFEE